MHVFFNSVRDHLNINYGGITFLCFFWVVNMANLLKSFPIFQNHDESGVTFPEEKIKTEFNLITGRWVFFIVGWMTWHWLIHAKKWKSRRMWNWLLYVMMMLNMKWWVFFFLEQKQVMSYFKRTINFVIKIVISCGN